MEGPADRACAELGSADYGGPKFDINYADCSSEARKCKMRSCNQVCSRNEIHFLFMLGLLPYTYMPWPTILLYHENEKIPEM